MIVREKEIEAAHNKKPKRELALLRLNSEHNPHNSKRGRKKKFGSFCVSVAAVWRTHHAFITGGLLFHECHTRKVQFAGYQRFSHRQRTRLRCRPRSIWPVQKKPCQSTTALCEGCLSAVQSTLLVNALLLEPKALNSWDCRKTNEAGRETAEQRHLRYLATKSRPK